MTSSKSNDLPKTPSPNTITLRDRAFTYKFVCVGGVGGAGIGEGNSVYRRSFNHNY